MKPLLIMLVLAGGCSAIDKFGQFTFTDGGGASGDMAGPDLKMLSPFGAGCGAQMDCQQYPPRQVSCLTSYMNQQFSGGMCTHGCMNLADCSEFAGVGLGAFCTVVVQNQPQICLPICNMAASSCRTGYMCCSRGVSGGVGVCAPIGSEPCR